MKASDKPRQLAVPFASTGDKNRIPTRRHSRPERAVMLRMIQVFLRRP
ncbi:tail fiber protein [Shigella dysenteriae]|uniref:Tail fiber protein n=1 Tax=Shigella dysenteriae TaxID=622 RepID=A0A2X2KBL0_SHIDY|nr:tail fiber protein [Shigella dysenteriae]